MTKPAGTHELALRAAEIAYKIAREKGGKDSALRTIGRIAKAIEKDFDAAVLIGVDQAIISVSGLDQATLNLADRKRKILEQIK